MSLSRRELLRRAGLLGATTILPGLGACDESGSGARPIDARGDALVPDAGGRDAVADTGGRDAADSGPEPPEDLPEYEYDGEPGPEGLFAHAVASGDPLPEAVILWTRLDLSDEEPVDVFFEVARDPEFVERWDAGWFVTDASRDWTVKVDAVGLTAGATYYYRFKALGRTSPIGRTRTAPVGRVDRLRFAVASCARYSHGHFHAYGDMARRADLDAVIHLGDYIYEHGGGFVRDYDPPHETVSLDDYRRRYAQYRTDPDLQEAHRQHPFIVVWDDHESANNSWTDGAEAHQPDTEGDWATREAAARQAYSEWMPIRDHADGHIYRTLRYGDLLDLVMLDTRLHGRDRQAGGANDPAVEDPARTILGDDQEAWLYDELRGSTAQWRALGQQVVLSPMLADAQGTPINMDAWDGYPPARKRLLDVIREDAVGDVVVLTGDMHMSWAFEVVEDPNDRDAYDPATGAGAVAVEFATPGITSPGAPHGFGDALIEEFRPVNPHMRWGDMEHRGFMVLDVSPERVQSAWFHLDHDAVEAPEPAELRFAGAASVRAGAPLLEVDAEPAAPPAEPPDLAPTPESRRERAATR